MPAPCADCQNAAGSLEIRKRRLCPDCFTRYVNSKVLKRMESYRFKNLAGADKRRLLLPLSGGISSLVLLHVLDAQLQKQLSKQNRTAYDLVVANVDQAVGTTAEFRTWYSGIQERFPAHQYLPTVSLYEVFNTDPHIEADLQSLGILRQPEHSASAFMDLAMGSASSVTVRADLREIFLRRLLVSLGKQHHCESILWGHSDSRLASYSLAGVAKGRGASVSTTTADGVSPFGIGFNFPMRDLFKAELELYASLPSQELSGAESSESNSHASKVSIKNTSIDDLLTTYITSQGEKYPSIMANVVRTTSKLQIPPLADGQQYCILCREAQMKISADDSHLGGKLCHGCERIRKEIKVLG